MGLSSAMDKWTGKIGGWLYNATGAAQQWANQKEAMQNAHQWEVADLRKAGLNPILSAGGTGASTGGASGGTPVADVNPLSYMNSALGVLQTLKNLDVMDANINRTNAETDTAKEQAKLLSAQKEQAQADTHWKNVSTARDKMEYDWWKRNSGWYGARMATKANPTVGTIQTGVSYVKHSAKELYRRATHDRQGSKGLRYYRYSDSY